MQRSLTYSKNIEITIIITPHAKYRMKIRGCDPKYVRDYFQTVHEAHLIKCKGGYMIYIPSKGWLIGVLEGSKFIVKTFLPFVTNGKKTPPGVSVSIRGVRFSTRKSWLLQ